MSMSEFHAMPCLCLILFLFVWTQTLFTWCLVSVVGIHILFIGSFRSSNVLKWRMRGAQLGVGVMLYDWRRCTGYFRFSWRYNQPL